MITVEKSTAYWQGKYDKNELTLVPGGAKTNPSPVWLICRRFVDLKPTEELPTMHSKVLNFAICPPCSQVIRYGTSAGTLSTHIHSKLCKVDKKLKEKVPLKKRYYCNAAQLD